MRIINLKKITYYLLPITYYSRLRREGFTLIEVLAATILVIGLGLGIVGLQSMVTQNRLVVWRSYLSLNDANSNLQSLVKELRMARTGDNGAYPLETVTDQEIAFYSDIDFDRQTEKVKYYLDGSTLYKTTTEPQGYPAIYPAENEKTKLLTENVQNGEEPVFYYYNGSWPQDTENNPLPIADRLSDTRLIKIYLKANPEAGVPDKDYILQSFVQVRMLKENL